MPFGRLAIYGVKGLPWPSTIACKDIPKEMDGLVLHIFGQIIQNNKYKSQPINDPYSVSSAGFLAAYLYVPKRH